MRLNQTPIKNLPINKSGIWWNCMICNHMEGDRGYYTKGVNQLVLLSCFSCVWLCMTLWTTACQASLSMDFSMQEYWSGLPCPPPPGDLPMRGVKPGSPSFQADSLPLNHQGKTDSVWSHLYVESNNQTKCKNITKQNQAHGYGEQRGGCQRKGGWGINK